MRTCCYKFFHNFSPFLCWEILTQTYVVIITIKSMFCHSMQCPLYSSNFLELKQSKQSSYFRCLWVLRARVQGCIATCVFRLAATSCVAPSSAASKTQPTEKSRFKNATSDWRKSQSPSSAFSSPATCPGANPIKLFTAVIYKYP